MTAPAPRAGAECAKLRRIWALVRKEGLQVVRDPSSFAIGIVLPVILILLYGYGRQLRRQARAGGDRDGGAVPGRGASSPPASRSRPISTCGR